MLSREQLSDEQLPIVNLPLDRSYIIKGGPGTGKTWMAIFRAAAVSNYLAERRVDGTPLFLVFNRPLRIFIQESFRAIQHNNANKIDILTYHEWLATVLARAGQKLQDYQERKYVYNWDMVRNFFANRPLAIPHIFLDEAQDFPLELIEILRNCSQQMTIFIDEHQAVALEHSTKIVNIRQTTGIEANPFAVSRNYRNTPEIYSVARLFFTGDENLLPETIHKKPTGRKPKLISGLSINQAVEYISKHAQEFAQRTVGVVLPSRQLRLQYYQKLVECLGHDLVQVWDPDQIKNQINFRTPGVRVLTKNAVKGLEFNTVFICESDNNLFANRSDLLCNQIYVSSTRALDDLFFLCQNKQANTFILQKLRDNQHLIDEINGEEVLKPLKDDIPF